MVFGFETLKARPLKIRVSNCDDDDDDECDSCSSVHDDNDVVVSKTSTECTQVEVSLEIKTIGTDLCEFQTNLRKTNVVTL